MTAFDKAVAAAKRARDFLDTARENGVLPELGSAVVAIVEDLIEAVDGLEDADKNRRPRWRAATEVEFTYEPTGERVRIAAPDKRSLEILAEIAGASPVTLKTILDPSRARTLSDDALARQTQERRRVARTRKKD